MESTDPLSFLFSDPSSVPSVPVSGSPATKDKAIAQLDFAEQKLARSLALGARSPVLVPILRVSQKRAMEDIEKWKKIVESFNESASTTVAEPVAAIRIRSPEQEARLAAARALDVELRARWAGRK